MSHIVWAILYGQCWTKHLWKSPCLVCHMEMHSACLEILKRHSIVENRKHFVDHFVHFSHLQHQSILLARFHTLYGAHRFKKLMLQPDVVTPYSDGTIGYSTLACSNCSYLESEISLAMCISGFQIESSSTKRIPLLFSRSSRQLSISFKPVYNQPQATY